MQSKLSIKIVILFTFIFMILIGGFIMLNRIRHNKNVIDTDLKEYIPINITTVLQINKSKDIEIIKDYTSIVDSISLKISRNLTYPICLIANDSQSAIIGRITSEQESLVRQILNKNYPSFPPKERKYKDATLLFYPISNNNFFCCLFYNGIFASGYNSIVLEEIVDTRSTSNFFKKFNSSKLLTKASNLYSANLFYNRADTIVVYNILSNKTNLDLEGYSNIFYKKENKSSAYDTNSSAINYSIFPNKPFAFNIKSNYYLVSDSISEYLILPYYSFCLTEQNNDIVHAIKLSGDRFILYNILNNLEAKLSGNRFNTNDFAYGNQRIYTTSSRLSSYIFGSKNNFYLSFYNGYLIFSENRKSLVSYLLNNGKFIIHNEDFDKKFHISNNKISKNVLEIFYFQSVNLDLEYSYTLNMIFNDPDVHLYGNLIEEESNVKLNILLNKIQ